MILSQNCEQNCSLGISDAACIYLRKYTCMFYWQHLCTFSVGICCMDCATQDGTLEGGATLNPPSWPQGVDSPVSMCLGCQPSGLKGEAGTCGVLTSLLEGRVDCVMTDQYPVANIDKQSLAVAVTVRPV